MMALINVCFIFWALRYLENSSLWNLPPIAILILSAPSLYLAWIINAITMTLITLLILIYKRPKPDNFRFVFVVTSLLIASSILITWAPYFRNVSWEQITTLNEVETKQVGLFRSAWESLFGLPQHAIFQWADSSFLAFTFKHADPRILSPSTEFQLSLVRGAYLAQAVFAFITAANLVLSKVGKAASPWNLGLKINTSIARIIVLSGLFIILSYTMSPWLRGAVWIKGERPDQVRGRAAGHATLEQSQPHFPTEYRRRSSVACFTSTARHEITVGGRKLVGSAQRRYARSDGLEVVLQHGSILLGPDHQRIVEFFTERDPGLKAAVESELKLHTTDLLEVTGRHIRFEEIAEAVQHGFEQSWQIQFAGAAPERTPEMIEKVS